MSVPRPLKSIAALSVAAIRLAARLGLRVFLELGAQEPQRRAVLGRGVQADRAVAQQLAPAAACSCRSSSRATPFLTWNGDSSSVICWPRKLTLASLTIPWTSTSWPLDQPRTSSSWPWMCSRGMPALIELSMKTTRVLSQRHQAGSPSVARPADLEVAPRRERPAVVEPQGELGHQRGHDLAAGSSRAGSP